MADELELEGESLSLRDALMSAVEEHRDPIEEKPIIAETAEAKADRLRDESGKFVKPQEKPVAAIHPAVLEVAPARPPKPSSWKKELDEHWNTLDPTVANYLAQREREYSTGVSTYKQEAERSRALQGALEPFMPELQRHNIQPEQWISNLGRAHQTLALGSPQQKHQMFAHLAREYGIDLGQLVGQPGQPAPQVDQQAQWMQEQIAQMRGELTQFHSARQQQEQATVQNQIQAFAADTAQHPHFDQVKETMAGLLQSGLAQDLNSAYDKAIRMHDDLWQSQQESQRAQAEADTKRQQADAAKSARAKVVSVKSATPSGSSQASTAKGRREAIAEAFASQGTGRV